LRTACGRTYLEIPGERAFVPGGENRKYIDTQVTKSLFDIGQYFNKIVSLATLEGDSNVNQIYLKLLKNISRSGSRSDKIGLENKFNSISQSIAQYTKFALMPNFELSQYNAVYDKAKSVNKLALEKILLPLLDSLEERMNALHSAKNLINAFHTTINEVLLDKSLDYRFGQGVSVFSMGMPLDPFSLSSGEKQLIIILSNLICKAESSSVIFIDEPEISLNIKWQRTFISMLENITAHSECQFYLATHSMEILGQHTDSIVNLNEQRNA